MCKRFLGIFIFIVIGYIFVLYITERTVPINEATKTCLITGASSGIGKAIAQQMIQKGWKVIGVSRNVQKLGQATQELGFDQFIPYQCDVADSNQVRTVSDKIKADGLQPMLFFLNAGIGFDKKDHEYVLEEHKQTFAVNYFGVLAWVQQWMETVKTFGGGTFVATSSVVALSPVVAVAAYSASKSALNACFERLRFMHKQENIGFALAMPGPVETALLKGGGKNLPFKQTPEQTARYIIKKVFDGKQTIEPSWFYSFVLRLLNWLPDTVVSWLI